MLMQAPSGVLQGAFETAQNQALQCSPEARHPTLLMTLHLMASQIGAGALCGDSPHFGNPFPAKMLFLLFGL